MHTKAPIRQSLYKSDVASHIMRWAIKLSEYDIEYTPRKPVHANTLPNFIAECTDSVPLAHINSSKNESHLDCQKIHVDCSAAKANREAGLAITSPKGSRLFYALKYTFPISNNESKYEVVLARLRVARTLHIQKLHIFTDSQVIAGHINGELEAKENNMKKYIQLV